MMRCYSIVGTMVGAALFGMSVSADEPTRRLAVELAEERDAHASAIEFRRLGLRADTGREQAGYFWAAAYQYVQLREYETADRMLDRVEDAWLDYESEALLLRAENAEERARVDEASFYWESLIRGDADPSIRRLASRRLAALRLRQQDADGAREALLRSPVDHERGLEAIERYERGRDKNPRLGGVLGMVPGLGYAYAGEYANALRSLILNSLFIWGMVETAQNDHWGAFAVITFFEITWYTGSIYGGIDASHRYNRERMDAAVRDIHDGAGFQPEWEAVPSISIRYIF